MNEIKKVVIIGGGPTGLAAALLLKNDNFITPVVYDANLGPTTLGGAIGISPNGLRLFKHLGVYEELMERGSSATDIVLHSLRGDVLGKLDVISWSKTQTGFGLLKIKRSDLMDVLCRAVKQAGIEVHYNKTLSGIKETGQEVIANFSDGAHDSGDFLLGCDGIMSSVRYLYVDPLIKPEYTGISDFYALVPTHDRPTPAGSLGGFHATFTESGMFAIMSCTKNYNENYWFFSYAVPGPELKSQPNAWEEHKQKHVEEFRPILYEMLEGVKGDWGSLLRDFVQQSKDVNFHPIFSLPLGGAWHKGRCLLLGDSAHAMSPHTSQGVSMALEDVFLLSRLLSRSFLPLPQIFELYDKKRRPRTDEMHQTAKSNGQMRKKTGPWRLWLNELAMRLVSVGYNALSLQKLGIGQKSMVYNIEEEEL